LDSKLPAVSIIIPVRNEEKNITDLLANLSAQTFPQNLLEIIFVDDHSTDATNRILDQHKSIHRIRLIHLNGDRYGKKEALRKGLEESRSEFILITDGDCRLDKNWIRNMAGVYASKNAGLVFGAVRYDPGKGPWNNMLELELLSLNGATAGAAGIGDPIMCNGANMGFSKQRYMQFLEEYMNGNASGDDVFFLLWMKEKYAPEIAYVKSKETTVYTKPPHTFPEFWHQRIRWVSKSTSYRDLHLILSSLIVYALNVSLLLSLLGSLIVPELRWGFAGLFSTKCIIDFIFLWMITGYYKRRNLLILFLPLQIIYFIYVSIIGFAGIIIPFKWKGRKTNPVQLIQ